MLPPALLLMRCTSLGLRWRVRLRAALYNSPSPSASVVPASLGPHAFSHFPSLPFCCPSLRFFPPPGAPPSFRHGRHLTRIEVQRHKLNQAEIHPGPAACVLAKPENAPHCYCAMEGLPGTDRQSGRRKIPLNDQMLASSWHMPLSCRGVGGNQSGKRRVLSRRGRPKREKRVILVFLKLFGESPKEKRENKEKTPNVLTRSGQTEGEKCLANNNWT